MKTEDIDNAIDVLESCYLSWADQLAYGEIISDAEAIKQTIKCLKGYKEALHNGGNIGYE